MFSSTLDTVFECGENRSVTHEVCWWTCSKVGSSSALNDVSTFWAQWPTNIFTVSSLYENIQATKKKKVRPIYAHFDNVCIDRGQSWSVVFDYTAIRTWTTSFPLWTHVCVHWGIWNGQKRRCYRLCMCIYIFFFSLCLFFEFCLSRKRLGFRPATVACCCCLCAYLRHRSATKS